MQNLLSIFGNFCPAEQFCEFRTSVENKTLDPNIQKKIKEIHKENKENRQVRQASLLSFRYR